MNSSSSGPSRKILILYETIEINVEEKDDSKNKRTANKNRMNKQIKPNLGIKNQLNLA